MLTDQRHQIIRNEIAAKGQVASGRLAALLGVSEDTIRRDLRNLAKAGLCRRVYGGAVAPYAGNIALRLAHQSDEKTRLARVAVGLIEPGQTVFIDAGSTNAAIAEAVPEHLPLTVATNSFDVVRALAPRPLVTLIVLGGRLDRETGAFVGPEAVSAAQGIAADVVFLGTCGFCARIGVTAFDQDDVVMKQTMVAASARVIVAATAEKLGKVAPYRVMGAEVVRDLVVSGDEPLKSIASFETHGTNIHCA